MYFRTRRIYSGACTEKTNPGDPYKRGAANTLLLPSILWKVLYITLAFIHFIYKWQFYAYKVLFVNKMNLPVPNRWWGWLRCIYSPWTREGWSRIFPCHQWHIRRGGPFLDHSDHSSHILSHPLTCSTARVRALLRHTSLRPLFCGPPPNWNTAGLTPRPRRALGKGPPGSRGPTKKVHPSRFAFWAPINPDSKGGSKPSLPLVASGEFIFRDGGELPSQDGRLIFFWGFCLETYLPKKARHAGVGVGKAREIRCGGRRS